MSALVQIVQCITPRLDHKSLSDVGLNGQVSSRKVRFFGRLQIPTNVWLARMLQKHYHSTLFSGPRKSPIDTLDSAAGVLVNCLLSMPSIKDCMLSSTLPC